jgi:6-phospho-beta-glucosidase
MKDRLKLAVIGGGSSYTPELIEGILQRADHLPVAELWLVDIPEGEQKLEIIADLARRMAEAAHVPLEVHATLDRAAALRDADFVVSQFRVGGLDARAKDESIPLKYGIIGQETTGPGGFCNAMRTIPVLMDICREIEELAPHAWLINFTNPSGINAEAILNHTEVRSMGLCNVPICMKRDIAKLLEVAPERIDADFLGLNHMSYIPAVYLDGEDILPRLLEAISDIVWDADFLSALGMLTSPYHRYYYANAKMLAEEQRDMAEKGSRARQVQKIEEELFAVYADQRLHEKPKQLEQRGGAYYSEAAVSLIDAIYCDRMEVHTVNVKNQGAIADLDYDAVIETNALIGRRGAVPLVLGKMPTQVAGLISEVKAYEQLTAKAAVERSYSGALKALLANPFVNDYQTAKTMLDEMIEAHHPYLGDLHD